MQLPFMKEILKKVKDKINDVYTFRFRLTSNADYELILEYEANAEVLKNIFKQVSDGIAGFKPTLKGSNPDLIESFEIPENLLNRVHTATLKNINAVFDRIRLDGVDCIRSKVESCRFYKDGDKTKIKVIVVGYYVRR